MRALQNWNYSDDNVHDSFNEFYIKLEGSVNSPKEAVAKRSQNEKLSLVTVSADILKLIKVRNKVFARKKRQTDIGNCKRLYNLLRNRINRVSPIHKGGSTRDGMLITISQFL